jgi:myo-inositol-1(or 4)-monophosphatase
MSEQLSAKGAGLKNLCDSIAKAVYDSIKDMVGTPEGGLMVKMGADGTPTKIIDRMAEDTILSMLKTSGHGFRVLSEEIGEVQIGEKPEYLIHLDPLDGTFNAIMGIPFYAVSIFISAGDCRFGYVCDLAKGTKYYAEKGRGAYSEPGGRLRVSGTSSLKDFSISAYTIRPNTARIVGIGDKVRRIRTLGSTSLEMSLVASGRLDAFVDLRGMLRIVDVAAGKLILEEAGGIITDADGKKLELNGEGSDNGNVNVNGDGDGNGKGNSDMWQRTDLIGSNGLFHAELLRLIGGGGH